MMGKMRLGSYIVWRAVHVPVDDNWLGDISTDDTAKTRGWMISDSPHIYV